MKTQFSITLRNTALIPFGLILVTTNSDFAVATLELFVSFAAFAIFFTTL
jgi:hypothetical protein